MARIDYERKPHKCAYSVCERPALPHGKVCEFHGIAYREQRNKERTEKKKSEKARGKAADPSHQAEHFSAHTDPPRPIKFWPTGNRIQDRLVFMATLKLSTGIAIQSEQIQQVEYYPRGSLFMSSLDFLYIRTTSGTTRITGRGAAQDADAIEQAGVRIYRRPVDDVSRAS
jgi:hypothetical protein